MSKHLHTLSLLLLLTLAGCGDPVVDPSYRGTSLLTVTGQLNATSQYQSQGPLHLALVWFPKSMLEAQGDQELGGQLAMVSEDVVFQGSFPAQYRFDVFQPPPKEALGVLGDGVQGKAAFGALVAYEDLNGNGKLDRIARDGAPVDRIVGTSLLEGNRSHALLYFDSAQDHEGLKPGFNVTAMGADGEQTVLPLSTPMPLTLTEGGDIYDGLMCEMGWLTFVIMPVCGLGDGEQPPPFSHLGVSGDVKLKGGHLEVSLQASYDGEPLTDAQLKLGERTLTYDSQRQSFVLSEDASTLLSPGTPIRLEVSARDESTHRDLVVPGPFTITTPAEGEQVSNQGPVTAQWTAAAGATGYRVELDSSSFIFSHPAADGELAYTFEASQSTGEATLRVEAIADSNTDFFDPIWVSVTVVQEQHFTFAP